jgi:purine-binding chemotaxis protein CheW
MPETVKTQYLTFLLSGVELGLRIQEVAQIIEHAPPTRVPHLPAVIRGVINLRGNVVPVVDLAIKLLLPSQPVTRRTCIVIVETHEAGLLGLLADSVHEVVELEQSEILPTPDFGVAVRSEYLLGLGKVRDQLVLLIDSAKLLSPAELLAAAKPLDPPPLSDQACPEANW